LDPVDVVIGNAAVQHVGPTRRSRDGLEETFAVNHLAHLALTDRLLARALSPGRVVFVSSDTHDADRRTGTPLPLDDSVADLARPGEEHGRARGLGMRRYVTTKLLMTAAAFGLADEHPDVHVSAYNPGVMPGTGLGRHHPPLFRAAWGVASRAMVALPFASTTTRSAHSLAHLACDLPAPAPSGSYIDVRLRPRPAAVLASDAGFQRVVLDDSRTLIADLT
ncbi:MAG: hypothetical protein ACRCZP_12015, partial [Phycicoccus sp.]